MYYGSPFYLASLLLALVLTLALWLLLRKCSPQHCRRVLLILSLINLLQHLLKPWIYPHYRGQSFSYISTAYNMCATMILLLPLAFLTKSRYWKNFLFFAGAFAGISALAFPHWFIGLALKDLGWEYFRFYLCHTLLFVSCSLPLLLGLHRPKLGEFWHIACGFFMALCIILINNFVFAAMGLCPGYTLQTFPQLMLHTNPCGIMGPPAGLPWLTQLIGMFSPSYFLGNNPSGEYVPLLWYLIPAFGGICLVTAALFAAFHWRKIGQTLKAFAGKHRK